MVIRTPPLISREKLDELYALYNHREFVYPDPLAFLYDYHGFQDREIVGLIASSLAYGRVAQILKSVSSILERMNPSPYSFLLNSSRKTLLSRFTDFKYRFTTGKELASLLWALKCVIERYGSLYVCFTAGLNNDDNTILPALSSFVKELNVSPSGRKNSLLPSPNRGSACKRLNLFLRWMVRQDNVDPGGWSKVPVSKLIVPLDTHMHRICFKLNLTRRKQADMRTAIDITYAFRRIIPEDPVRYDFAITRLGIRKDGDLAEFLKECGLR
jgi:uncharacterized protein (TIGR02757 family)